jgi:hypothetical protein
MMNLDIKDKEQKKIWEAALKDMESDNDWDSANPVEQAYKKQKLSRYTWTKNLGLLVTTGTEQESELKCTKDVSKRQKSLDDGSAGSSTDKVDIKFEHAWILPSENTSKECTALLSKVRSFVHIFKKMKIQLPDENSVRTGLAALEEMETKLLEATLVKVGSLAEEEAKQYVQNSNTVIYDAKKILILAEEGKKKLKKSTASA